MLTPSHKAAAVARGQYARSEPSVVRNRVFAHAQTDLQHVASNQGSVGLDRFDLAVVGIFVLACLLVARLPFAPKPLGDNDFYNAARGLSCAIKGQCTWQEVDVHRLPGAVAYYAVPYLAIPASASQKTFWQIGVLWNLFWMAVATLLIRRAGHLLGGPLSGKLAAALSLLAPFSIYYSFAVMAETPAYLGGAAMAYGAVAWVRSARPYWEEVALTVAGLSLMVLSRTNIVLLFPIMMVCGFVSWQKLRRTDHLKFVASCITITTAVFSAVTVLMLLLPDAKRGAQLDNLLDVAMQGRFQFRTDHWDWRFWQYYPGRTDYISYMATLHELQLQSVRSGVTLAHLEAHWIASDFLHHPLTNLEMFGIRLLSIHTALVNSRPASVFKFGPISGRPAYFGFHLLLNSITYLIVVLSVIFLVRERQRIAWYWSFWAPWLALLVFHAIVYAEPRYLMPARPGLVVMATIPIAAYLTPHSEQYSSVSG